MRLFFDIPRIARHAAGRDWYFVVDKASGELRLLFRSKAVVESAPAAKFLLPVTDSPVQAIAAPDGTLGSQAMVDVR